MKKVIVFTDTGPFDKDVRVFSTREKLLEYFQILNHSAKSLRVKELDNGVLQILNHNTPVDWWQTDIQEFKIDDMEIR